MSVCLMQPLQVQSVFAVPFQCALYLAICLYRADLARGTHTQVFPLLLASRPDCRQSSFTASRISTDQSYLHYMYVCIILCIRRLFIIILMLLQWIVIEIATHDASRTMTK